VRCRSPAAWGKKNWSKPVVPIADSTWARHRQRSLSGPPPGPAIAARQPDLSPGTATPPPISLFNRHQYQPRPAAISGPSTVHLPINANEKWPVLTDVAGRVGNAGQITVKRSRAAVPNARLVGLPATTHIVPVDNPTGILELLAEFLAEPDQAAERNNVAW
jgi:pimeloyl-ACP methyl ester carboxylesterase